MEDIQRRESAKAMVAEMRELQQAGRYDDALALSKRCLALGNIGPHLQVEVVQVQKEVMPILDRAKAAAEKARRERSDPTIAQAPTMKLAKAAQVLGLDAACRDEDEIKRAYRVMSLKHHPDRNRGREEAAKQTFVEVQEAYDALRYALDNAVAVTEANAKRRYDPKAAAVAFKRMLRDQAIDSRHAFSYIGEHCSDTDEWMNMRQMGERRQAFTEYMGEILKLERQQDLAEDQKRRKRQKNDFLRLLATNESITPSLAWPAAEAILTRTDKHGKAAADHAAYADLPPEDRAEYFSDFVAMLRATEAEAKKAKERKRRGRFRELLQEIEPRKFFKACGLSDDAPEAAKWAKLRFSKVDDKLRPLGDKRYKAIASEDRRYEFEKFCDDKEDALEKEPMKRKAPADGDDAGSTSGAKAAKKDLEEGEEEVPRGLD